MAAAATEVDAHRIRSNKRRKTRVASHVEEQIAKIGSSQSFKDADSCQELERSVERKIHS